MAESIIWVKRDKEIVLFTEDSIPDFEVGFKECCENPSEADFDTVIELSFDSCEEGENGQVIYKVIKPIK